MTPHGFLQAAAAHHAVARPVHLGVEISFVAGGRRYAGVLNERNQVDRVRTWMPDPVYGDMLVETFFRDYERFGRVLFPTHITQDRARRPALDLWVSSVEAHYNKEHR